MVLALWSAFAVLDTKAIVVIVAKRPLRLLEFARCAADPFASVIFTIGAEKIYFIGIVWTKKVKRVILKIPTFNMSKENWLSERRNSLGGSEIGAVLGLNKYATPYSIWAEKTGRLPPREDNEAMRQGRDFEAYVAHRFSERSRKQVHRYNYLLRNDAAPHLHANIDRRIVGERSGLECKIASALNMRAYSSGEFPESYYAQCVAYLAVTEWDRWYLAALVLNKAFCVYQITTVAGDSVPEWCESSVYVSPEELDTLKRCAADFWETYITPDIPPPLDGLAPTAHALEEIYGTDNGERVELIGRDVLIENYFSLSAYRKGIEAQMNKIKQTLQEDMGQASYASCSFASISWRTHERRTFDGKAFQKAHPEIPLMPFYKTTHSRVFKINPTKERL